MYYFKSIRFKITLWYLLIVFIILACFGVIAYLFLSLQLSQILDETLKTKALEVATTLRAGEEEPGFTFQTDSLIHVYDAQGTLLYRLGPDVSFDKIDSYIRLSLFGKSTYYTDYVDNHQIRLYVTSMNVSLNNTRVIIVGLFPTENLQTLRLVRSVFVFSTFIALVIVGLGGLRLINRTLYPIRRIMGVAEDIGETNLDRRIEINREDELGRLATTLNKMMERLEIAFNRERQFAGDASHELRTPLSVIEAETTLTLGKDRTVDEYKKSLEVISQEVEFMSTVIGNLLSIARHEAGNDSAVMEKLNIKDILDELSPQVTARARAKGLRFIREISSDLFVNGDRIKMKQLFMNIFENAIRYTEKGHISVKLKSHDDLAAISIIDTGVGIAEEHIPHIFERFYRVDKARSRAEGGAGLGLSIAKQIAESHGGRIEVESHVGKGSTFRVILPLFSAQDNYKYPFVNNI